MESPHEVEVPEVNVVGVYPNIVQCPKVAVDITKVTGKSRSASEGRSHMALLLREDILIALNACEHSTITAVNEAGNRPVRLIVQAYDASMFGAATKYLSYQISVIEIFGDLIDRSVSERHVLFG